MKRKIFLSILAVAMTLSLGFGQAVSAGGINDAINTIGGSGELTNKTIEPTKLVTEAINYLMFAIGVISVVMIIIGGIRYATSSGDPNKVKSAKNTILYAGIGLAVALLALALVQFVKARVESTTSFNSEVTSLIA